MTKWTPDQEKAINSKNSVIISASAGTGKTAVLTEKVVKMLLSGTKIENLLIMTFSNKAAEEMKTRIRAKLQNELDRLNKEPASPKNSALKIVIYDQLHNFSNAHIQTVHSFCYDVIKKYYYLIPGLDPKFTIAEELSVSLMKYASITNVLEPKYKFPTDEFNALFEYIDESETLEQVFISNYNNLLNILNPFDWLDKAIEKYNVNTTSIPKDLYDTLIADFEWFNKIYSVINIELNAFKPSDKEYKYVPALKAECDLILTIYNKLLAKDITAITKGCFLDFGLPLRLPDTMSKIKDLRDSIKSDIVDKYKKTGFDLKVQIERVHQMHPFGLYFKSIMKEFHEEYQNQKKAAKVIDFNDMEHYCYKILSNEDVSTHYKNQFSMVFIDEYQDTSPIQEEIIKLISNEDNIFCVGDLKQSIYRFRSSDPTLFKSRMELYSKGSKGTLISLNNNFRSSTNVLNCANDVFNHITKSSSEISYTTGDKLIHSRKDSTPLASTKVDILDKKILGDEFANVSSNELEIYNIVKIIKNRIGKPVYDHNLGKTRPAEYSDFCILTRNITAYIEDFNKIFIANGIPFIIDKADNIFTKTEVLTLISLMSLIINNNNDLALITIIHNGLFNFTDEDLITIRNLNASTSYFDNISAISKTPKLTSVSLSNKCKQLIGFLTICKQKERLYSLSNLVSYIIDRSNIKDVFAIEKNGAQKIANLNLILNYSSSFEKKSHEKLYGFLKYISQISETQSRLSEAVVNKTSNQVTITTIHKSKGLEYPIVILGFMGKTFNNTDRKANIIIDKDAGVGFRYFNNKLREKGSTYIRKNINKIIEQKTREEEMRLLYVAMTRAQEELYIQGSLNSSWVDISNSHSMSDWIFSTIISSYDEKDIILNSSLSGVWEINKVKIEDISSIITSSASLPNTEDMLKSLTLRSSKPVDRHIDKSAPIPKITSATSAQHINNFNLGSFKTPKFMQKKDYTQIGTNVHKLFKFINFKNINSEKDLLSEIEKLKAQNIITQEELDIIPNMYITNIGKILNSPLFAKFKKLECLKEKPFYFNEKSSNLVNCDESVSDYDITVRCIVDLAVVTDEGIYIVDYKTDNLDSSSITGIENIVEQHKKQLEIYEKSLSLAYGKKIIGSYLALISTGDIVKISHS